MFLVEFETAISRKACHRTSAPSFCTGDGIIFKKKASQKDLSTDQEDNQKITDMLKHIEKSINELNKENPEGRQVLKRLNYNPNMKFSKNRLLMAQKELS